MVHNSIRIIMMRGACGEQTLSLRPEGSSVQAWDLISEHVEDVMQKSFRFVCKEKVQTRKDVLLSVTEGRGGEAI